MKVSLSRSRFPIFLFISLVFIVIVLLYYYWNLSSSNQILLRELKILESGKFETERRRSALESQVFEIENERRLAEEDLEKERSKRLENERMTMEVSSELQGQLEITKEQLYTARENEVGFNMEMLYNVFFPLTYEIPGLSAIRCKYIQFGYCSSVTVFLQCSNFIINLRAVLKIHENSARP